MFDYLFYRFYFCSKNKEKAGPKEAFFTAFCAIGIMVFMLTSWIWWDLCYLFYFEQLDKSLVAVVGWGLSFLYVFHRYRNKIDVLEKRYKKSPVNKYLSDYLLWLFILLASAIGFCALVLSSKCLKLYFEEGEFIAFFL